MLDLNFENSLEPGQGCLLVANPFMAADYFQRSVILLCRHNENGSFGFVLNNYLDLDLNEFPEDFLKIESKLSVGGPVDIETQFYLHTFGNKIPNSLKITENLFLGGDFTALISQLNKTKNPEKNVRFFVGYSGWEKGQLEAEIKEKSWIVVKFDFNEMIMDTSKTDLWQECLQKLGGKYKMFSQIPVNPNNN